MSQKSMPVEIVWGTIKYKGDPVIVRKELLSIGEEVDPEAIVQYAENNPDSELHKCFTWDNTKAAHNWRVFEARSIKANLVIKTIDEKTNKPVVYQALMRTRPGGGYEDTTKIFQVQEKINGVVDLAKRELKSFSDKYRFLTDARIQKIISLIDEL